MRKLRVFVPDRRAAALLALTLAAATLLLAQPADEPEAPAGGETAAAEAAVGGQVFLIHVDSVIHPVAAEWVRESLAVADEAGAAALVIELNTPGGLSTSTREITQAMLSARTPVVVFVSPSGAQAASAGFFILMAADVAAMAPGTNTGAAHPVGGQGEDIEGHMGEKVEQDAAANIRSLAGQHGRNVELAEAAVLESRSFTAEEALEQGLIEVVAAGTRDLLVQIDGREVRKGEAEPVVLATAAAELTERRMPVFRRILSTLAHPAIAGILMALGLLGVYIELSNPGAILPGVVGAICLILAFYALSVLPVNYAGVALLLLALILFIAETQVPSFGLLTVGGAVALVLGAMMLFKDLDPALRLDLRLITAVAVAMVVVTSLLAGKSLAVRRTRVQTGSEGLVSERGVARTSLAPRGKVFVHGELWNAVAEGAVEAGCRVEVVAVDGMTLRVRPCGEEPG